MAIQLYCVTNKLREGVIIHSVAYATRSKISKTKGKKKSNTFTSSLKKYNCVHTDAEIER